MPPFINHAALLRISSCCSPQVASHLLSDRQKDQLAGLVMLMCSYSLTYKNVKSDPVLSNLRDDAASDALVLALDPHLFDFIKFKVLFLFLFFFLVSVHYILPLGIILIAFPTFDRVTNLNITYSP